MRRSGFGVGAAALVDDHRMVAGCNENVSYGLGLCAECAEWSAPYIPLAADGWSRCPVRADGEVLMPCAEVLLEHGGADLVIDHPCRGLLAESPPDAFGPDSRARSRHPVEETP